MRRVLRAWASAMPARARVLAASTDPGTDGVPALDAAGRRRNRTLRQEPGAMRLRIRYRQWRTPWFPWLFVAPSAVDGLVRDTGWSVAEVVTGQPAEPFVVVLDKA